MLFFFVLLFKKIVHKNLHSTLNQSHDIQHVVTILISVYKTLSSLLAETYSNFQLLNFINFFGGFSFQKRNFFKSFLFLLLFWYKEITEETDLYNISLQIFQCKISVILHIVVQERKKSMKHHFYKKSLAFSLSFYFLVNVFGKFSTTLSSTYHKIISLKETCRLCFLGLKLFYLAKIKIILNIAQCRIEY